MLELSRGLASELTWASSPLATNVWLVREPWRPLGEGGHIEYSMRNVVVRKNVVVGCESAALVARVDVRGCVRLSGVGGNVVVGTGSVGRRRRGRRRGLSEAFRRWLLVVGPEWL